MTTIMICVENGCAGKTWGRKRYSATARSSMNPIWPEVSNEKKLTCRGMHCQGSSSGIILICSPSAPHVEFKRSECHSKKDLNRRHNIKPPTSARFTSPKFGITGERYQKTWT